MRKLPILFIIISLMLLVSCSSKIVRNGGVAIRSSPSPTADLEEAYSSKEIVYITKSGTKYHRQNCVHLSKSKIPISLEQALQQGLEPCKECSPLD